MWAGTLNGLFQLQCAGDAWTFRRVELHVFEGKVTEIHALLADASGDLLVG